MASTIKMAKIMEKGNTENKRDQLKEFSRILKIQASRSEAGSCTLGEK
jgi:hypothetical protein